MERQATKLDRGAGGRDRRASDFARELPHREQQTAGHRVIGSGPGCAPCILSEKGPGCSVHVWACHPGRSCWFRCLSNSVYSAALKTQDDNSANEVHGLGREQTSGLTLGGLDYLPC